MNVIVCDNCNGTGEDACEYCAGTGYNGNEICPICDGSEKETCSTCWGSGDLEVPYGYEEDHSRESWEEDELR